MRKMRHTFYCLCMIVLCISGCGKKEPAVIYDTESVEDVREADIMETDTGESEDVPKEVYVHVCGCVRTPGVYRLKDGMRIQDALEAAGGMTEEAEINYLNQAETVTDGQKIYVPSKEEAKEKLQTSSENRKINLNTASIGELTTLSGVGESRARAIIQYREAHQGFRSVDEIMKIEGIKEGVFQKIKDSIVIE